MPTEKEREEKRILENMLSRRQSRRLAIQILFCNEFLQEDISIVANRISSTLKQELSPFCKDLIFKTFQNKEELEKLILNNLRGWDLERVALLDRILIMLALSELLYFNDIPIEVTINEALELSKEFINYKSSRFINGILDGILKKLQKQNKIHKDVITRISPKHQSNEKPVKGIIR
jgi:N utilization substance protein B